MGAAKRKPAEVIKIDGLRPKLIKPPKEGLFRLRLAGRWQGRDEGFVGLDWCKTEAVDHVVDLKVYPWPIADGVVDFIAAAFYFHRLTMAERFAFMNECGRVLKSGGQMTLIVPDSSSARSLSDPFAQWPAVTASSFIFFNKAWREKEKITPEECARHNLPTLTCDFGENYGGGYTEDPDLIGRNDEFKADKMKHGLNYVHDLNITLTKAT